MSTFNAAIFDFDGTIADSGDGIINCAIYALKKFGIEENDRVKLRYFIGPPLYDSFMDLYGVSREESETLVGYYRERYATLGCEEASLYPGVAELLKTLREHGVKTGVCSSKPQPFIEKIAARLGVLDSFDFISGISLHYKDAEKDRLLRIALEGLKIENKSEAVMIGDRHFDIDAAKKMGVASVGAVYGFGSREELTAAGADYLVDSAPEIEKIVLGEEK